MSNDVAMDASNTSRNLNHGERSRDVELSDKPLEDNIMQLARLGEVGAIQKLFQSGKYDASYKDEQGVTPLHVSLPRYLSVRICAAD